MPADTAALDCIVVDDEPLARSILERYITRHAALRLAGSYSSATAAAEALEERAVDIMFLDVRMPRLSGIEFARTISAPPAIIFTTAHSAHAVEAFELRAVDYLLKPIAYERFEEAVARVLTMRSGESSSTGESSSESIFVRSSGALVRLRVQSIGVVEALENYVRFHATRGVYIAKRPLKEIEELLSEHGFVRVHRSFLVNAKKIDRIDSSSVRVGQQLVPLSRSGREALRTAVDALK